MLCASEAQGEMHPCAGIPGKVQAFSNSDGAPELLEDRQARLT